MDIPAVECSARYGIDRGTGRSKKNMRAVFSAAATE
jgi:hypothetical protein